MQSTGNNPDWTQAPPWAAWWACDQDGEAFWYAQRPYIGEKAWRAAGGRVTLAGIANTHITDWRKAVARPPEFVISHPRIPAKSVVPRVEAHYWWQED